MYLAQTHLSPLVEDIAILSILQLPNSENSVPFFLPKPSKCGVVKFYLFIYQHYRKILIINYCNVFASAFGTPLQDAHQQAPTNATTGSSAVTAGAKEEQKSNQKSIIFEKCVSLATFNTINQGSIKQVPHELPYPALYQAFTSCISHHFWHNRLGQFIRKTSTVLRRQETH